MRKAPIGSINGGFGTRILGSDLWPGKFIDDGIFNTMMESSRKNTRQGIDSTRLAGAAALMIVAGSAGAVGISNVQTNNLRIDFWGLGLLNPESCDVTQVTSDPGNPLRTELVQGSNSACVPGGDRGPGGYIELGAQNSAWNGGYSTLTGEYQRGAIVQTLTVTSVTQADWETGTPNNRLVDRYIREAITANCGGAPDEALIPLLSACFMEGTEAFCGLGNAIIPPPAQRASDPDIAFADRSDATDQITIGLAGLRNAAGVFLPAGFVCPPGTPQQGQVPNPLQLSEVARVTSRCGPGAESVPQFLYGFTSSPSGITGLLLPTWYDAIYEVQTQGLDPCFQPVPPGPPAAIPVMHPFGLALMSLGLLMAAGWARRRR